MFCGDAHCIMNINRELLLIIKSFTFNYANFSVPHRQEGDSVGGERPVK